MRAHVLRWSLPMTLAAIAWSIGIAPRILAQQPAATPAQPGAAGQPAARGGQPPAPEQGRGRGQPNPNAQVEALKVQGSVYMLVGAGGNVALQVGDEGVLLVDTGTSQMTDKLVAKIREVAGDKPIRYIINTHVHTDHTGGNEAIGRIGSTIAGGNVGPGAAVGATIIAHENVLTRMSAPTGRQAAMPFGAWPTDTYVSKQKELYFNGESIRVIHQPNAHTDGDSIVHFQKSDVVCAGDIFVTTTYPVIDEMRGGSINGILAGLNNLLDIAIPKFMQEGGTYIIPGHGRLTDEADLLEYRDMVTIIRDRVQDAIKRGLSLDQVKAAKLTIDWDGRWGATSGFWTTDMFLEAVYKDLSGKK